MKQIHLSTDIYNNFSHLLEVITHHVLGNENIVFDAPNYWYTNYPSYRLHSYKGIQVSQVLGIYLMLNKSFLSKFDSIIEIGTYNGGLSTWIYDNKNEKTKFITYDIDLSVRSSILNPQIDARLEDCFSEKTFNDITNIIAQDGKCLILCDGGDKPKEFNEFSKYLKSGDHIMCHDYCKDESAHEFVKQLWQWPYHVDTFYKDIENTIMENNLEPFDHDGWHFFLWGSYIKK